MQKGIFLNTLNIESKTVNNATIQLGDIDDSGKGRRFTSRFIQPGLVKIEGHGIVLLKKETLDSSLSTIIGSPVIIEHENVTEENANELRCGVISNARYNEFDGWYYVEGIIWDDKAQELINKGWSVSCSYDFLAFNDEGGEENNIHYDKEFTQLNFTHLALVDNPRYERANIVFNCKVDNDKWITIKPHGDDSDDYRRLKLEDGETPKEAIDRVYKKEDKKQSDAKDKQEKGGAKDVEKPSKQVKKVDKSISKKDTNKGKRTKVDTYTGPYLNKGNYKFKISDKESLDKLWEVPRINDIETDKYGNTKFTFKELWSSEFHGEIESYLKEKGIKFSAASEGNRQRDKVDDLSDFIKRNSKIEYFTQNDYGQVIAWEGKPYYTETYDDGETYEPGFWSNDFAKAHSQIPLSGFEMAYKSAKGKNFPSFGSGKSSIWTKSEVLEMIDKHRNNTENRTNNSKEQDNMILNALKNLVKHIENAKSGDDNGRWITIKGTHVFIPDGKSVDEVMKEKGWGDKESKDTKQEEPEWLKHEKEKLDRQTTQMYEDRYSTEYPETYKKNLEKAQKENKQSDTKDKQNPDDELVTVQKADTHKLEVRLNDLKSRYNEVMKYYWEADEDDRDIHQYKADAIKDEMLSIQDRLDKLKKNKTNNSKEQDMLLDEIKKLISKVENEKGEQDMDEKEKVDNENVDKRKLIDEVAGIMKSAGCDDEDIRTAIGKMEKIGYDASEDSKADNKKVKNEAEEDKKDGKEDDKKDDKKVDNEEDKKEVDELKKDVKEDIDNKCKNSKGESSFDKINAIYNSVKQVTESSSYVSRQEKLDNAVEYFK